ncbi:MAG: S8 family serine peptidase, partial [Pyrinomonadaceae bacterium]|nr:S8 family serine peptidase [Phycisphaerales bacterium]
MRQDVIILRNAETLESDPLSHNFTLGVGPHPVTPPPFKIEHTTANWHELPDIRSEQDTVAAAMVMPMSLYTPVAQEQTPISNPSDRPWGIAAVGAHTSPCLGIGARIAILDTGIDAEHEAFSRLRRENAIVVRDFTNTCVHDTDGHGTHCAGTAFGGYVGDIRVGVASGIEQAIIAKVICATSALPCPFCKSSEPGSLTTTSTLVDAIDWAIRDQGAHLVSMSLGIDYPQYVARLIAEKYP